LGGKVGPFQGGGGGRPHSQPGYFVDEKNLDLLTAVGLSPSDSGYFTSGPCQPVFLVSVLTTPPRMSYIYVPLRFRSVAYRLTSLSLHV